MGYFFVIFEGNFFFEESRQNSNSQNCWVKRTTASADLELLSSRYSLLDKSSVSSFFPPPKLALLIFSWSPYFLKHCQLPTSELHEKFLGTHNFWLNQTLNDDMVVWVTSCHRGHLKAGLSAIFCKYRLSGWMRSATTTLGRKAGSIEGGRTWSYSDPMVLQGSGRG